PSASSQRIMLQLHTDRLSEEAHSYRQEIPAGTPAARAFDPCSVAAAPELRPLKRHATFAAQRQRRLRRRGCCTGLPTNRRRHFRWCLRQVGGSFPLNCRKNTTDSVALDQ